MVLFLAYYGLIEVRMPVKIRETIRKHYWKIEEVAEECTRFCRFVYGPNHPPIYQSKIRFWENEYPRLAPKKRNDKNYRKYTQQELYTILHFTRIMESGDYTIPGGIKQFENHKPLNMVIRVERVDKDVVLPSFATTGAACFDIRANETVTIEPGDTVIVKTGMKMEVPHGYEVIIRPRSGISLKSDLRVANSPGTIDSDYRGEVGIILDNIGDKVLTVAKGDRIAQGKLQRAEQCNFIAVESLSPSDRGEGGFGSTGTR